MQKNEIVSEETKEKKKNLLYCRRKAPVKAERMTSPEEDKDFDWEIYEMGSVEYTDDV